jgi:hypothetical protein
MSVQQERGLTERVGESPSVHVSRLKDVRARDLGIRFLAGAATSIVAALVTLWLGPRVGGAFLAFPAILAASLTLIEENEDSQEAREDARGAVLGGCALAAFAAVAAIAFLDLPGALALILAGLAWLVVAVGGYVVFWR